MYDCLLCCVIGTDRGTGTSPQLADGTHRKRVDGHSAGHNFGKHYDKSELHNFVACVN